MTLIEFLNARLSEDEAAAQAAGSAPWVADVPRAVHVDPAARAESRAYRKMGYVASVEHAEVQAHIARHNPARVLREVAARRTAIVEAQQAHDLISPRFRLPIEEGVSGYMLRLIAVSYADHPDYRQEWAL